MIVILDTNIISADARLTGPSFQQLLRAIETTDLELMVPEVVIMEARNNAKKRIVEALENVRKGLRGVRLLTDEDISDPLTAATPDELADQYESSIRDTLQTAGATIIPIPQVSHADIIERIHAGRKPFKDHDQGYRDALIWESVLAIASIQDETIAFVSNNKSDFGEQATGLFPDLIEDLTNRNLEPDSVVLYNSLFSVVEAEIEPILQSAARTAALRELEDGLESGVYHGTDVHDLLGLAMQDYIGSWEFESAQVGLPPEMETPSIFIVEEIEHVEAEDLSWLADHPDAIALATVHVQAEIEFWTGMTRGDYFSNGRENFTPELGYDIDNSYILGTASGRTNVSLRILIDTDSVTIESIDVIGAEPLD